MFFFIRKPVLVVFIALSMFASFFFRSVSVFSDVSNETSVENGLLYLRSQQDTAGQVVGFSGVSEWASMAFSAANVDINTVAAVGGVSLRAYLLGSAPDPSASSTEWSRKILAITAAADNPYDFGGVDYVSNLKLNYSGGQIGNTSQLNDDIFGLLALISANESTSSAVMTDTLNFILSHQNADNGFSWSVTGGSDIDDTASAVMALKAAQGHGLDLSSLPQAIEDAKIYLLTYQNLDGGFAYDPNPLTSWDTSSNVSSTSWVLMALNSLGLENSAEVAAAQTYLRSTQEADGSFPYQPIFPPGDTFNTAYAVLSLTGKYWPIAIYPGTAPTPTPTPDSTPTPTSTPTPIPTATPTPTPTPTSTPTATPTPTSIPTATPTLTPTPTVLPAAAPVGFISPTTVPTITVVPDSAEQGNVLGVSDDQGQEGDLSVRLGLSRIFLVLGVLFAVIFYYLKFYRRV